MRNMAPAHRGKSLANNTPNPFDQFDAQAANPFDQFHPSSGMTPEEIQAAQASDWGPWLNAAAVATFGAGPQIAAGVQALKGKLGLSDYPIDYETALKHY